MYEEILIYDLGSQYTQLIARKARELGVFSRIVPPDYPSSNIGKNVIGLVLSGGPQSVYEKNAVDIDEGIFHLRIPILGICYGHQLIAYKKGGKVKKTEKREYGRTKFYVKGQSPLFEGIPAEFDVWMSHGDVVEVLPDGFVTVGMTDNTENSAIMNLKTGLYGLQFHPEVVHTEYGKEILKNFLKNICNAKLSWSMSNFLEQKKREIITQVEKSNVLLALSGGVDSSVLAELLHRTINNQLFPIFVDTGLLKKGEKKRIERLFSHLKNLRLVDASERFYSVLKGICDPEEKRKIIGREFAEIFSEEPRKLDVKIDFLAQGTLYPDVIESGGGIGPSSIIKTHHNVGGLPPMPFRVIEPFRELFKDEVRELGRILGLPSEIIERHPFPGPGFAVRILGEVTEEKALLLQDVDEIIEEELHRSNLYNSLWQVFPVLLPVRTVGVMGDERTYEYVVVLRAVVSVDGMTADWARLPYDLLDRLAGRIVREIKGVNRVVYDITSKPPGTIEWE